MQQEEGGDGIGIPEAVQAIAVGVIEFELLRDEDQHGVVGVEVGRFDDDKLLGVRARREEEEQGGQHDFFHISGVFCYFY